MAKPQGKKIEVMFTEDYGKHKAGDTAKVAAGHARNFLLSRNGPAVPINSSADPKAKERLVEEFEKKVRTIEVVKKFLSGLRIPFTEAADENGKLYRYEPVTPEEIAKRINLRRSNGSESSVSFILEEDITFSSKDISTPQEIDSIGAHFISVTVPGSDVVVKVVIGVGSTEKSAEHFSSYNGLYHDLMTSKQQDAVMFYPDQGYNRVEGSTVAFVKPESEGEFEIKKLDVNYALYHKVDSVATHGFDNFNISNYGVFDVVYDRSYDGYSTRNDAPVQIGVYRSAEEAVKDLSARSIRRVLAP